jgi:hypothetical protein
MGLSENEQKIWKQLEDDLLAEPSISAVQKEIAKEQSAPTKRMIIGALLVGGGAIGLITASATTNIWVGLASFFIMIYGVNYAYEYLKQLATGKGTPKNKGFADAYENLKNYNPRNKYWN